MPEIRSQSGSQLLPIERPLCPKCSSRTSLISIEAGPKGLDLRNFQCAKCGYSVTATVATDPMRSDKLGWLAGELKPPR